MPMYGTGWMANQNNGGRYGHHQQNNPNAYNAAPPAYGAPQQAYPMQNQDTGATFRTADGYYGNGNQQQQEGVYGGGAINSNSNNKGPVGGHGTDYAPPPGPPPAHTRP